MVMKTREQAEEQVRQRLAERKAAGLRTRVMQYDVLRCEDGETGMVLAYLHDDTAITQLFRWSNEHAG